jgi:hypothetical protein
MEAASGAVRERPGSPLGCPLPNLPACAPISNSSNVDKLAYASPKVQSTIVVDGNLPPDVLAEWSDVLPDDLDASISTDRGIPGPAFDADACGLHGPGPRRRWSESSVSLRRRADILEYPMDREGLLYDRTLQILYCLNETAFYVWRQCDGRSLADLASALTRLYDVEHDAALEHVMSIVELLSVGGLFAEESLGAAQA